MEAGRTFDVQTSADSTPDFQLAFRKTGLANVKARAAKLASRHANPLSGDEFVNWLGGRDSPSERSDARRQGFAPIPGEPKANRDATESASQPQTRLSAASRGWEAGIRTPITWARAGRSEVRLVGACRVLSGSARASSGGRGRCGAVSGAEFHKFFTRPIVRGAGRGWARTRTGVTLAFFCDRDFSTAGPAKT